MGEFDAGRDIVLLDAPTGSGKTLIGELVRQHLGRGLYLCSTLHLQDQFLGDYPDAAVLKGRSNYRISPLVTAADCNKRRVGRDLVCSWCAPVASCPYEKAKRRAFASDLVCSNISFFLHEANYAGGLPRGRDIIIVDEADLLEEELMRFVEVRITERRAREYGIEPPAKKTVAESWVDWALMAEERVSRLAEQAGRNQSSVGGIRRARSLVRLLGNLRLLLDPTYGLASGHWIYTEYDRDVICFRPVRVAHLAHTFLWSHGVRWLLMSATMISFHSMASDLGLDPPTVSPSRPPSRPPIAPSS